jgi:hypothetical protein
MRTATAQQPRHSHPGPAAADYRSDGFKPNLTLTLQDYTMSKVLYTPVALALLVLAGCAQQPGPPARRLFTPGAHTASADWTLPGGLAQTDDQDDDDTGPSLEDRARALFGDKALRGTLPPKRAQSGAVVQVPAPRSPASVATYRWRAGLPRARQVHS